MTTRTTEPATELVLHRTYQAPRQLVFDAWTRPEYLKQWQGAPRGFTVTKKESDIRPGGTMRVTMRSPDGQEYTVQGVYRDIVPPERIVFTHAWLDAAGKPGHETLVSITLREVPGGTELTLRQTGFASVGARDGHAEGWSSTLDVLGEMLAHLGREQP